MFLKIIKSLSKVLAIKHVVYTICPPSHPIITKPNHLSLLHKGSTGATMIVSPLRRYGAPKGGRGLRRKV